MTNFIYFYNEEWNPFEGDVPWEKNKLPENETFKRRKKELKNFVYSMDKYNGIWRSDKYKLEINFLPKKKHIIRSKYYKSSIYGLMNGTIKKNIYIFPLKEGIKPKKQKKIMLEYFKNLGFKNYENIKDDRAFFKLRYKPLKRFVARNYGDDYMKKKTDLDSITNMLTLDRPELLYSPYMTINDQYSHIIKISDRIKNDVHDIETGVIKRESLMKEYPERLSEFKKLQIFIDETIMQYQTKNILDIISDYTQSVLLMDLSLLIYNYEYVKDIKNDAENGLYLYKRYNTIPLMVHSIIYPETKVLYANTVNDFIDIKKWKFKNNLYIINNNKYFKIKYGASYVNIKGKIKFDNGEPLMKSEITRTNNFNYYYLVQNQHFKNDKLLVNLHTKIELPNGTVRINPLCRFKIFFP
jgi:hypothetical protein